MVARRTKRPPKHVVDISLRATDIARLGAAVTFKVREESRTLATIEIGQGGFRWRPRSGKSFKRIRWPALFARLDSM
jgi:hypothetical protein